MTTIKDLLKVNKTCLLLNFGRVTLVLIGLWDSVTAVGEIRMFKSSTRSNLQNMTLDTRKLWTNTNMRTPLLCAEQCKNDNACVSFFYNKNTLSCEGHSMTLGITNRSTPVVGNKYYVDEDGEGYIGDVCTNTTLDCKVTNSECRNGACWCAAGYSFWPRSRSCDAYCTTYGTDFTEVLGHFLSQNNEDHFLNVSFENCTQSCLSATLYTCITFEYGWQTNDCYLQSVTKLDKPTMWFEDLLDRGFGHYQRDCL